MIKRYLPLVLLILLVTLKSLAQNNKFEAEGDELFKKKDYKGALASYFRALHDSREDPKLMFKIGLTYLSTETRYMAVSYLEKAYKKDPDIDSDILYHMGMAYQSNLQYAKAKSCYDNYKKRIPKKKWPEVDQRIDECLYSHGLINNPIDVIIENAGSSINSPFNDYSPVVSADGATMIFTSTRSDDPQSKKPGYETIYISRKIDEEWTTPKRISSIINKGHHDAAAFLSADGKTLILYYDDHFGDLYKSTLSGNEWSVPVPFNRNINSPQFRETCASISADGKKLYFSSTRPGGMGGLDIYVCELDPVTHDWGAAKNMGPMVNSPGDEDSPFIHPDGVTLYFSSDGHRGMGSSDIFKSINKDGKWTKPQNLGYPINSIEYDGFFSISEDKSVAYFATKRKYGVGEYDIIRATYRNVEPVVSEKPALIAKKTDSKNAPSEYVIYGKAIDKTTSKPMAVSISLVNSKLKRQVENLKTNPATGEFEIIVKEGGDYVITAESDGYLYNSINFSLSASSKKKIATDFVMTKADVGSIMVLKNLFFDTNKADLKSGSIDELEKIKKLLLANPKLRVQINGHTDNVGDPTTNKTLSLKRALAVVNYLALNGIEFERLSAKGFGSEKPIASNDDEIGGREFNRRTEIEILDSAQEL